MSKATVRVMEVNGNARAVTFVQISAHTYSAQCRHLPSIYVHGGKSECRALKPASAFAAAVRRFWK